MVKAKSSHTSDRMDDPNTITLSRLTAATATDFLRDYTQELNQSGADGQYTKEIEAVVAEFERALENNNQSGENNEK